ncbi:MAG: PBSX family phage terminase large subunit [Oscillospiraceae bacterium]|nr:PBSX family phage terminase large subunit [Oscillospiraceae bacterium]
MGVSEKAELKRLIAPSFFEAHLAVKERKFTHFWLPGGRGSGKSSFVSIELILSIMRDAKNGEHTHALAVRRFSATLRESVFAQLLWAVQMLGVRELWETAVSPFPRMVYLPTGQSILFRGLDDPSKLKSLKTEKGSIAYLWVEEASEAESAEKLRSILQSVMRGNSHFTAFYSFNPPKEKNHWINLELEQSALRDDTEVIKSDYRSVDESWLGEGFLAEAEHLKKVSPERYRHEYLGEAIGSGAEVFKNVTIRCIEDDEMKRFDKIRRGIDWGYAADPFAYNVCHLDSGRRRLYIFFELHKIGISNREAALEVKKQAGSGKITCDSAEPKSIDEFKSYALRASGAKKGPDSVSYGIKWLAGLDEIIIDPERCPYTAKEFRSYCLKETDGVVSSGYPDRDNHHIDAVRYACEEDMSRRGVRI